MENSALQKKLIQQVDKYDRDMEVITQVCSRSAQGVTLVCFIYSCADSLPRLPTYLPLSLLPSPFFSCCVFCLFSPIIPLSLLHALFYNRACPHQTLLP